MFLSSSRSIERGKSRQAGKINMPRSIGRNNALDLVQDCVRVKRGEPWFQVLPFRPHGLAIHLAGLSAS